MTHAPSERNRPAPLPGAGFWDRIARRYAARPVTDVPAYHRTLERIGTHLRPDHRVLELGCGTGTTALKLAGAVADYRGTDLSGEMIAIAQNKLDGGADVGTGANPPSNVEFARADAISALDAAGPVDVVLASSLLHLVDAPDRLVRCIHDRLPPGGLFMSKTVCLAGRWYLRPVIVAMRAVGKAPRVTFFSVEALGGLMTDAGFEIVEQADYPARPPNRFIVAVKPQSQAAPDRPAGA